MVKKMKPCNCEILDGIIIDFFIETGERVHGSQDEFARAAFSDTNKAPRQKWNRIRNVSKKSGKRQALKLIDACFMAKAIHMDFSSLIFHVCETSKSVKHSPQQHTPKKVVKKTI